MLRSLVGSEMCIRDSDEDTIVDSLDTDSDGAGISDNAEVQYNQTYVAPSGIDNDNDGLDDAYDLTPTTGAAGSVGLTPADTNSDGTPDYLDDEGTGVDTLPISINPLATGLNTVISGQGVPGATIVLTDAGDNVIATAPTTITVAADGTWTATPDTPLADGTEVTATQTSAPHAPSENSEATQAIMLEASGPSITSVALSGDAGVDNTWSEGDTIPVTVTFDAAVTVTGIPFVELNIGGEIVAATYASGSGTTDLVFEYVVHTNDSDTDGISIAADAIVLNGGSIDGAAAADLSHTAVADDVTELVDAPAVLGFALAGDTSFDGLSTGQDVSSAGDVNGDGFDDFIVGVPLQDNYYSSGTPSAFVIYGGADASDIDLSLIHI